MNIKKNYLLLCLNFFFIYISNAFFLSFFQIYLASKNFSESKIGIISSITPLLCLIANPLYSFIGKNSKWVKRLLTFLCFMEIIVILLVLKVNEFSLMIVVMCLVAMIDAPLFMILDSYASTFVKEHNKNYSYIRIIGTFSYAIGALLAGVMIKSSGFDSIFMIAALFMIIALIITLLLKPNTLDDERKKGDFVLLLKNKSFLLFAIYFIFIFSFLSLGDTYISIYLNSERNISETMYGILTFAWVIIEMLVVIILNLFKIKNERILLIIIGLSYISRFLMIGVEASNFLLITSALIRGIGMGISVYIYIPLLNKIIKSSDMSIAILFIGMIKSLLATLMISSTGFFIEKIGYSPIFIIWTIIFGLIIASYAILSKKINKLSFY